MFKTVPFIAIIVTLVSYFSSGQCRLNAEARLLAEKQCVEETKVNYNLIREVAATQKLPDDNKYKAFLNCYHIKQGFKDESGKINFDQFKEVLVVDGGYDESTSNKILYPCKNIKASDPNDLPVLIVRCIFENAP